MVVVANVFLLGKNPTLMFQIVLFEVFSRTKKKNPLEAIVTHIMYIISSEIEEFLI